MKEDNKLSATLEDYLESIKMLCDKKGFARVKEISKMLNVEMPSVTSALKKLKDKRLIVYEKYGYIKLTPDGNIMAKKIYKRHEKIKEFFEKLLNIDSEIAQEDACKIEHSISEDTFNRVLSFLNFLDEYPEINKSILDSFKLFLEIESKT
jgi:DtxR family Mn-dependent transcriptional regulator